MARSYARVMTAVWRDQDFLTLSQRAQRLYLVLVTQPDISAVGTLALRIRRWASLASDTDASVVAEGIKELAAARFVVADTTTEELLIRSFVKWDGGYSNTKRRPVILEAAQEVLSPTLRRALTVEFKRLGLPTGSLGEGTPDSPSDAVSDGLSFGASDRLVAVGDQLSDEDHTQGLFSQVDSLSDRATDVVSPSDRVVVQVVGKNTTTLNPQPIPASPERAADTQSLVGSWLDNCRKRPPRNVIGQVGKHVKAMLDEGIAASDVHAGLTEWSQKGLHPSTLPSVINEIMNRSPIQRGRPAKPTHLQRVTALDALKTGNRGELERGA